MSNYEETINGRIHELTNLFKSGPDGANEVCDQIGHIDLTISTDTVKPGCVQSLIDSEQTVFEGVAKKLLADRWEYQLVHYMGAPSRVCLIRKIEYRCECGQPLNGPGMCGPCGQMYGK